MISFFTRSYAARLREHFDDEPRPGRATFMLADYCDRCASPQQRRVLVNGKPRGQACYMHLARVMYDLIQRHPDAVVRPEFREPKVPEVIIIN